mmetsp:Transcript_47098/g.56968  ORF Transcript_47098/g.56968 Transcript_47098/m.56968 type:complete len:432 (-) Transcript_47098:239-1534(-)
MKNMSVSPTPTMGELSSQYVKLKLKLKELSKPQFCNRDHASYDDKDKNNSSGTQANPAIPNSSSPSTPKRRDNDNDNNNNTSPLSTHRQQRNSLTPPQPQHPSSSFPTPPATGAITNDTSPLHAQLKRDIRTAGLRKGRENALIDRVDDLIHTYKTLLSQKDSVVRQWTVHADAVKQDCHNRLRTESRQLREVTAERDAARERADDVAAALETLKRRIERVKDECRETIANERKECAATVRKELETRDEESRRHCRVALERAEERFRDAKRRYESEALQELNQIRNENETLKAELEKSKGELQKAHGRVHDLERRNETIQNKIRSATETSRAAAATREENEKIRRDCEARVSDVRIEMKRTTMKHAKEMAALWERKRDELHTVETRVKRVVEAMAEKVAAAEDKASKAEARARRAEGFIEEIEGGFEEVLP